VAGVELVVVVVDLVASGPGAELVVVVLDLVTSGLGFVLVAVVVDLVTSSAEPRASSSIIVAISIATNIFFISKPLSFVISILLISMNHVCCH
jgi:predicted branched-subunit amino acid permease